MESVQFNMVATEMAHKKGCKSVNLTEVKLKFGAVVAESHPQVVLWALTDDTRSVFKTLPLAAGVNCLSVSETALEPLSEF